MESIIEKIKKIQALAERGVEGEAQAAKLMLEKILKQYGLTMEDLSNETAKERCFVVKTDLDKAIFIMCGYVVLGKAKTRSLCSYRGESHKFYLELTDYEFVEFSCFFEFHKSNAKKEFTRMRKDFQSAYQFKHNLYLREKVENPTYLTKEEIEKLTKFADAMEDVQFFKMIEQ